MCAEVVELISEGEASLKGWLFSEGVAARREVELLAQQEASGQRRRGPTLARHRVASARAQQQADRSSKLEYGYRSGRTSVVGSGRRRHAAATASRRARQGVGCRACCIRRLLPRRQSVALPSRESQVGDHPTPKAVDNLNAARGDVDSRGKADGNLNAAREDDGPGGCDEGSRQLRRHHG